MIKKLFLITAILCQSFSFANEEAQEVSENVVSEEVIETEDESENEEEVNHWEASVNLSPMIFKKVGDEQDINYGSQLSYEKDKYEFFAGYERNAFSSTDPLLNITVRSSEHRAITTFDINDFYKKITIFALIHYRRKREGSIYTTRHRIQGGPIGAKYTFIKNRKWLKDLSISYIPIYEYIEEELEDSNNVLSSEVQSIYTRNLRHSIRFRVRTSFFENTLKVSNVIFYRPAYKLNEKEHDFKDADIENTLSLSYSLNDYLSLRYDGVLEYDIRQKKIHGLPSVDISNTFSFEAAYKF